MKTIELNPDQIITLNDYPVHSDSVLSEYFGKCKMGEELPLVPVIRRDVVRRNLDDELVKKFEEFEGENPTAEYFMLDGSHRTTALTLALHKIAVLVYQKDEDIVEARKLVATGKILKSGTLQTTMVGNCEILSRHFSEKPYFMTVQQKTDRMVADGILPQDIVQYYH
tara:strand:- start:3993 stop:4496 length:504 start_codon:yes stop_codon:yes gene_type:complete